MKKCFLICPIGEEGSTIRKDADDLLEFVVQPACDNRGYTVIRADKISDNGMITQSIIENILQSDLAIADLSGRNPNVFYELAIRHSFGLPIIQITKDDMNSIPFDVHNVRTIHYDLSASGAKAASIEIGKVIESIEQGGNTLNPVTSVANILQITTQEKTDDNGVLSELLLRVNSIPEKLDQLENNIGTRFSQMLIAFGESIKLGSNAEPQSMQDVMLSKFLETFMNDPQKGVAQMQNLMAAQKMLEANGLIKKQ